MSLIIDKEAACKNDNKEQIVRKPKMPNAVNLCIRYKTFFMSCETSAK